MCAGLSPRQQRTPAEGYAQWQSKAVFDESGLSEDGTQRHKAPESAHLRHGGKSAWMRAYLDYRFDGRCGCALSAISRHGPWAAWLGLAWAHCNVRLTAIGVKAG